MLISELVINNLFSFLSSFCNLDKEIDIQLSYNESIVKYKSNAIFVELACPKCEHKIHNVRRSELFYVHDHYPRSLYLNLDTGITKFTFKILRLKCIHCGATHAVIPENIIPYLQITYTDAVNEINYSLEIDDTNPKHHLSDYFYELIINIFNKHFELYWFHENNLSTRDFINEIVDNGIDKIKDFFNKCKQTFLTPRTIKRSKLNENKPICLFY